MEFKHHTCYPYLEHLFIIIWYLKQTVHATYWLVILNFLNFFFVLLNKYKVDVVRVYSILYVYFTNLFNMLDDQMN